MNDQTALEPEDALAKHFIAQRIDADIASDRFGGRVVTRFPPEPNGYLHLGHAKAICLDFGMAETYGGQCHLRFDDTNPEAEDVEFVESIQEDLRWLGFDWGEHLFFASDYYEALYNFARQLIAADKAYVCTLDVEAFKAYRGEPTRPGKESPCRNRPVAESLDLFARMRAGEFSDGEYVVRAKIDMASPNLHMRDPVIYRIKHLRHHRTGDTWCVYPMYDFTHCISDSLEKVTHSLCTLEFEVHRPLYEWVLEQLDVYAPQQIEFSPLNLSYTVMSKRILRSLIQKGHVSGWDDPRLPTLGGMRRRGYTPASIRNFCDEIGVTKYEGLTRIDLLEHSVRNDLNKSAQRRMAVLDPLKVVIENYPEGEVETFSVGNNPEDPTAGKREVPFGRELYIERADFMEDPPKKFFRLAPGREVRLRGACFITCNEVVKNDDGDIVELRCSFDPESRGGSAPDGRRVKATLHWVACAQAVELEIRLYDRLLLIEDASSLSIETVDEHLNPDSLKTITGYAEPSVALTQAGETLQFERVGYFCADEKDHRSEAPVFNRTATLRDTWAKMAKVPKKTG
ncbi:MAG: glutamine--tRNA ligase/YqeY domain fusion protein [Kiritimatiellae bacterium]|nr:glutamine--tRNA ligase/YqeY domain fusion protein [Kiritimatiellia bacterium]